jgi:hypothetical protein
MWYLHELSFYFEYKTHILHTSFFTLRKWGASKLEECAPSNFPPLKPSFKNWIRLKFEGFILEVIRYLLVFENSLWTYLCCFWSFLMITILQQSLHFATRKWSSYWLGLSSTEQWFLSKLSRNPKATVACSTVIGCWVITLCHAVNSYWLLSNHVARRKLLCVQQLLVAR